MIITLTETTLQATSSLAANGLDSPYLTVGVVLLLMLLIIKELYRNAERPAAAGVPRAFAIATAPLLLVFAFVFVVRLLNSL